MIRPSDRRPLLTSHDSPSRVPGRPLAHRSDRWSMFGSLVVSFHAIARNARKTRTRRAKKKQKKRKKRSGEERRGRNEIDPLVKFLIHDPRVWFRCGKSVRRRTKTRARRRIESREGGVKKRKSADADADGRVRASVRARHRATRRTRRTRRASDRGYNNHFGFRV